MSIQEAQDLSFLTLSNIYPAREAHAITDLLLEHITLTKRIDRLIIKHTALSGDQEKKLLHFLEQLVLHTPIQYVLGEAWFCGMSFLVNDQVLIPRPETEELVEWVVEKIKTSKQKNQTCLDIGTGSGCIPISLQKKLPEIAFTAIDISLGALAIAAQNASKLQTEIKFLQLDFLDENAWENLPVYDLITSNPPYIKKSEKAFMNNNVLQFEPHIALFVEEDDALIFYRKIAHFANKHLSENGLIFMEINEALGEEVKHLFEHYNYEVQIKQDMQGKDRMVSVRKK